MSGEVPAFTRQRELGGETTVDPEQLPVLAFGVQFIPLGFGPAEYRSAAVGPTLRETPNSVTLAEGASDLAPAQKLRWQPLRARFQPREEGEHTLILEIPQPVSSVDVIVREVNK